MFSNEPYLKADVKTSGFPTLERGPKHCLFSDGLQQHKATKFGQITRHLGLLRRSRSSKVTEFGTNRKVMRLPISD